MTRNLTDLRNCEEIVELLELASKEQDQDAVGTLFEEILRRLEDREGSLPASLLRAN